MTMFLVTPPALEPVTIADARAFLRISTESEDDILGRLITTARELVEAETGLALIDQTWRLRVDRWPRSGRLALFKYPIKAVTGVVAYRPDGAAISFCRTNLRCIMTGARSVFTWRNIPMPPHSAVSKWISLQALVRAALKCLIH
ncbi:phage head-tail connector protein [Brucella abortus]